MKRRSYIFFAALTLLLASCSGRTVYSHYEALPQEGWHQDSAIRYDFEIADTLMAYDLVVNLRHTDRYPNQNFWLIADLYADSLLIASDSLDYYLADQRGRWLGNGFGNHRDMPMLYKHNFRFPLLPRSEEQPAHRFTLSLRHGMRDSLLHGATDLGFTIEKVE